MKVSRISLVAILLAVTGLFSSCATSPYRQASVFAFTKAEQAISIPHAKEMEKEGIEYVTVFPTIADAGMWGVESVGGFGVWPLIAELKNTVARGYAYLSDFNFWGDFILQGIVVGRKSDLMDRKELLLNRDGGFVYNLQGKEGDYEPQKFEKDESYQSKIFAQGMTLSELEVFWRDYCAKRGIEVDPNFSFIAEIRVGSPEWDEFKADLEKKFGNDYRMPDGEIRQGHLSLEEFRKEASKNHGLTSGQRFRRELKIPVATDPISFGAGVAGTILNGVIAANSDSWDGFYARAEGMRKDLMPTFRDMQKLYKSLLVQRDEVIFDLQERGQVGR